MTITPAYLRPASLSPDMVRRPRQAYFVRPADYRVVDGDTLRILAPAGPADINRPEAFRIRFRSIAAPEKPKPQMTDILLEQLGIDAWSGHPGVAAKTYLRNILKGHCILVEPMGRDRYGRTLADISVSGSPGAQFDLVGARSVEWMMKDAGLVGSFSADQELPPRRSMTLVSIEDDLSHLREAPSP